MRLPFTDSPVIAVLQAWLPLPSPPVAARSCLRVFASGSSDVDRNEPSISARARVRPSRTWVSIIQISLYLHTILTSLHESC